MSALGSQITTLTIMYSTFYSGANQRKHQSSASLAFRRRIHRWPVNSPHEGPVTQKMFPFHDVIMIYLSIKCTSHASAVFWEIRHPLLMLSMFCDSLDHWRGHAYFMYINIKSPFTFHGDAYVLYTASMHAGWYLISADQQLLKKSRMQDADKITTVIYQKMFGRTNINIIENNGKRFNSQHNVYGNSNHNVLDANKKQLNR